MSLQAKNRKKNRKGQFFGKNRKGVSIMVGYVLLVVFAIILSTITYQWIKTYIPSDSLQCPDSGVSVSIKAVSYDCEADTLYLLIKNNGRFNILGYFAHAANVSGQEVATIDLSQYFNEDVSGGQKFGNSIAFISAKQNLFKPGDEKAAIFNLNPTIGEMTSIQITPTRLQEVDNKNRFISCGNERVEQEIYCGMDTRIGDTVCIPNCAGRECGSDGCGGSCLPGCDPITQFCDYAGQCILNTCAPAADPCGTRVCGPISNNSCGTGSCGDCPAGKICDVDGDGLCVPDGICDPGETCADLDCDGERNGCTEGNVCDFNSGNCVLDIPNTITECSDFCVFLGGYSGGTCKQNSGCPGGGTYESEGDYLCPPDNPLQDFCCCNP